MYPDAHVYIHRAEQAARARAHERSADHPAPTALSHLRRAPAHRRKVEGVPRPATRRLALLRR